MIDSEVEDGGREIRKMGGEIVSIGIIMGDYGCNGASR